MAGKSTYMRQVALITLMAQCGSFVPATFARLGVVDKIFTRIGASDDLSMGQSTFMVEMMEVATILKEATQNSLVILDEIGRGTSTYDGLSIAWAVAEYMSDKEKCGAKTLFATHYHELIGLEQKIQGVKNYSIAVKEKGEDIIFLRKIVAGGTDESYGVHVAKLAGVPQTVTKRSNEILRTLERKSILGSKEQEKENKKKGQVMNIINKLSVVISVYNEEAVLDKMYQAVVPVVESLPCEYELLFVNDGSKDASPAILDRLAMESEKVKVIHFSRNYGHEAAMIAGIDYSTGDGVICMDADLQHPVECIPQILDAFHQGYEVVSMVRTVSYTHLTLPTNREV